MADTTREKIIDAAGPIFASKGYRETTVREICDAAGANVASVNYYFGDKHRLYTETVRRAHCSMADQAPHADPTRDAPAEQRLREFVTTLLTRMIGQRRAPWQARLMLREMLDPTNACREMVEEYIRPQHEALVNLLSELAPAETPMETKRLLAFSVVGQCLFYRVAGEVATMLTPDDEQHRLTIPRLADHIVRVILGGVEGSLLNSLSEPRGEPARQAINHDP